MREEINEEMLESVNGGRYVINGNLHRVAFRDAKKVYQLKNCTDYEAMALMDSFVGKYATEEEYDNACIAALRANGWI
ncbi:MAG: hypothetical protein IKP10_03320 [Clostridia bacterium]|nr:hypothetical protein [Clostridia bacterium]